MGKCKNIECNNETVNNRVYCSLTCRNVYVNKHLRDYNKNGISLSKEKLYYENPKKCLKCDDIIPYDKRGNKFCGHSCSASVTNKIRIIDEDKKIESNNRRIEKLKKIRHCMRCGLVEVKSGVKYCSKKCRFGTKKNNANEYRQYQLDCRFNFDMKKYSEEFDFRLVETHGWYSATNSKKPNLEGVSRDHMLSIRDGFKNKIDPKIISHPANCKLLLHRENKIKHTNSSITLDELLKKIEYWDKKYGSVV